MPGKNTIKIYTPETFYHAYNRGVAKADIFKDREDYTVFISLLKRYLGKEVMKDLSGREYPNFNKYLDLNAFCLMPNHFHLLIYQKEKETELTKLMSGLCTSYTRYFNKKYKRVGHLFQGRFKAVDIKSDQYLLHISRYIHMNPRLWETWEFSSLGYYLGDKQADWMSPEAILELFDKDREEYKSFIEQYQETKSELEEVKHLLADQ